MDNKVRRGDPVYDEDLVNLRYLRSILGSSVDLSEINNELNKFNRENYVSDADIYETGYAQYDENTINGPRKKSGQYSGNGSLITISNTRDPNYEKRWVTQFALDKDSDLIYMRKNIDQGGWTDWTKMLYEPNVMTARMSANYTLPSDTNAHDLNINHEVVKVGDRLTVADGGIKIGKGVNYVMISGHIYWYTNVLTTSDTISYIRRKRGDNYSQLILHNQRLTDNYEAVTLPSRIVYVEEGDVIVMTVANNAAKATVIQGTYDSGTFLTVQAVG